MILDWAASATAQIARAPDLSAFTWTTAATGFVPPVTPTATPAVESGLGGSKPKKKIRGPYSDPRIFEEYVKRCIAEREQPRVNVEVAVLKEALVEQVEERSDGTELAALRKENEILARLVVLEKTKRDVRAIQARQQQIERQLAEMEDEEMRNILALFMEM